MKKKRYWFKEFYQKDPTDNSISFYRQRRCEVILEEVGEYKHNVFIAEVTLIKPLEPFKTKNVAGGCRYRFQIGERFLLRRHKGGNNKSRCSIFSDKYWFDVRYPGRKNLKCLRFTLAIKTYYKFSNNPVVYIRKTYKRYKRKYLL